MVPQHEPHFNEYLIITVIEEREKKLFIPFKCFVRALRPISGLGCEFNNDKSIIDCRRVEKLSGN